jgi:hypothetical protein
LRFAKIPGMIVSGDQLSMPENAVPHEFRTVNPRYNAS